MAADNINENPEITVTTVARDKRGRFVSVKKPDQVKPQVNLEASLKEILKFLVDNQKATLDLYNSQSEKINKTNDHLGNIENELSNLEKYFGQLTSFFSKKDEEDQKDAIEHSFQKINNQHLKNILIVEQKQLKELEMLNEQFIDFFEMNEKNIQDQKEQTIEREREAAAPPPTIEQPKQEAAKDIKKNEGLFSGFGSIVKNTFGGLLGIGKGIFKGLGTIFSTLFSIVSVPFKFISSALGSILSFIPGFGIISKFMPSFSMGMGGLLSTLGIGALGYVGFKYLTDDKYKAGVDKYMGGITKFFSPFINAIKGFFDTPIGQAINSFVGNLWEKNIKPGLESIKQGIVDTLKTFIGEDNWKQLIENFSIIKKFISDHLPKSYKELSDSVKKMANSVVTGINTMIKIFKSLSRFFGPSADISLLDSPFPSTELSSTPYTAEGTFTGSSEQMKKLIELSRAKEGVTAAAINKSSGAAGYHQFMPSTFGHLVNKLKQDEFLKDVNLSAKDLGKPELDKEYINKVQQEYSKLNKEEKSKYIANLDPNIQDVFFIAFNKDIMGTMKRTLGRDISSFEMKFAGFGTGNVAPIIKSAELGEKDSTYNVLKRVYAQSAPGGEKLTTQDLQTLSVNGDTNAFFELAKKSKLGNFESLVNQNPNLFYKLDGRKYNENILLTPSETIEQYKKYLGVEVTQIKNKNVDNSFISDAKAKQLAATTMIGGAGYLGFNIPNPFTKLSSILAPHVAYQHHQMYIDNPDFESAMASPTGEFAPTSFTWTPINTKPKKLEIDKTNSQLPLQNNFAFGGASPTTVTNTTIINNPPPLNSTGFGDLTNK